jgi:hypothetical protein
VEAAVEADGIDEQLVARGVAALQDDAAVGIVPTGRHDDGQFNVREAGDGLQFRLVGPYQTGFREHEYAHLSSLMIPVEKLTQRR